MSNDNDDELAKRKNDTSQLFINAKKYLEDRTLETYIDNFCGRIVEDRYAKVGLYAGKPQIYIRVVKTFIGMGDYLCDTPEFAASRYNDAGL